MKKKVTVWYAEDGLGTTGRLQLEAERVSSIHWSDGRALIILRDADWNPKRVEQLGTCYRISTIVEDD